ncbi:MAG: MraY family glycosyltransferase [Pirellulales bacterium]
MNFLLLAVAFVASLTAGLCLTPLIRSASRRIGFTDKPDAHRKIHTHATALGGGVAVIIAVFLGVLTPALILESRATSQLREHVGELAGLGAALLLISAVGLLDDFWQIRARYKLLGQIACAAVAVRSGLVIETITLAGETWPLGWLSEPLTIFWLVACMNALNLIDGADGLASIVGISLCGTIAATSISLNNELSALVAIAVTGSLLGFLRYNFPPASIYLGDTGSMAIGLIAGSLTVHSSLKGAAAYAMTAPLAMWVIPLMDVGMAVIRRKLTGRGLSATDRAHLHHCLLARGLGQRQLLALVGALCMFSGLGAWLTVRFGNGWFAAVSGLAVIGYLVSRRMFGHVELQLAGQQLAQFGRQLRPRRRRAASNSWQSQIRLQGIRGWEDLWAFLIEDAERLRISRLCLDINIPWLHESYHANWSSSAEASQQPTPRLYWPLMAQGRPIGTLMLNGDADSCNVEWLEKLAEFLAVVQMRFSGLGVDLASLAAEPRAPDEHEAMSPESREAQRGTFVGS